RVPTKRIMTVSISVGTRFPAYATSMGRVLLAGQPEEWLHGDLSSLGLQPVTRHTVANPARPRPEAAPVGAPGWAMGEHGGHEGLKGVLRAVAAPIRTREGMVVAAINISSPASRGSLAAMRDELLPHLLKTAALIEDDLAGGNHRRTAAR